MNDNKQIGLANKVLDYNNTSSLSNLKSLEDEKLSPKDHKGQSLAMKLTIIDDDPQP